MCAQQNLWVKLKVFSENLQKRYGEIRIIVFGSTALGNRLKESDIDILLVSDKFENIKYVNRSLVISNLWHKLFNENQLSLHLITLTEKEFEEMRDFVVVKQAMQEGIMLS